MSLLKRGLLRSAVGTRRPLGDSTDPAIVSVGLEAMAEHKTGLGLSNSLNYRHLSFL